jgi:hypothetical protein
MPQTIDRIRGRLVELEVGYTEGIGWVAVGIVKEGLAPEVGRRFEATATDAATAEQRLREELEAYFA